MPNDHDGFGSNLKIYNPLFNGLGLMVAYSAISETAACIYCLLRKNFQALIGACFTLVLIAGLIEFYKQIRGVPIEPNYRPFFLYMGLSHILFGVLANIEKNLAGRSIA